ncbi:putative divalent cation/proton antiporter TMEM165 [Watersipora subatra]|uniref:putative divalent cation/proton antiporter TMEM165 n=1 Tax=Watersipora subatra TaxID=2589382 RepID=UPI00355C49E8
MFCSVSVRSNIRPKLSNKPFALLLGCLILYSNFALISSADPISGDPVPAVGGVHDEEVDINKPQPVDGRADILPVKDEVDGDGDSRVKLSEAVGPNKKIDDELTKERQQEVAGNAGFIHAFVATLSVIIVSELGDKTFFISAIMAMRHSRLTVFAGAMTALAFMHIISAMFGTLATLIPRKFTLYLSSGLFALFGLKMLREGWKMSPDEGQEEYEETQAELKKYEDDQLQAKSSVTQDPETGIVRTADPRFRFLLCVSPLFIQAATLNFLAEWGDRSQIAAIVLAARENLLGVILGGVIGHFLCTGLAVIGGRAIAQKLSVRTVTIIGGVVFLIFAVSTFFVDATAA